MWPTQLAMHTHAEITQTSWASTWFGYVCPLANCSVLACFLVCAHCSCFGVRSCFHCFQFSCVLFIYSLTFVLCLEYICSHRFCLHACFVGSDANGPPCQSTRGGGRVKVRVRRGRSLWRQARYGVHRGHVQSCRQVWLSACVCGCLDLPDPSAVALFATYFQTTWI